MGSSKASVLSDELVAWLCPTIARACHLEPARVTAQSSILDLGLDSLTLVSVLAQIEIAHAFELSPDETLALLEATDIRSLARRLAAIIDGRRQRNAPEG